MECEHQHCLLQMFIVEVHKYTLRGQKASDGRQAYMPVGILFLRENGDGPVRLIIICSIH